MERSRFAQGIACALLGAALWGFSGSCAQLLLGGYEIDPTFITTVRMLCAGALFLIVLAVKHREKLLAMLRDSLTMRRMFIFGLSLYLCQFTYLTTIDLTNAGTATLLQSTGIAFTLLFVCLMARRFPKPFEWGGLVLALVGTWLIATHGDFHSLAMPLDGLIWGLVCGLVTMFYVVYPKRLFEQWGSFAVTGMGMFCGGFYAIAMWLGSSLVLDGALPVVPALDMTGVGVLAIIVVVGTFAAFGLYLHGVSIVGSVRGSMLGAIEPLVAMILSAWWLGTVFTGADWLGFVAMVSMTFLVAKS